MMIALKHVVKVHRNDHGYPSDIRVSDPVLEKHRLVSDDPILFLATHNTA